MQRTSSKANEIDENRSLGELEEVQLLALLETSLSLMKSPLIESGILESTRDQLDEAAKKQLKKEEQAGIRAIYQ